MGQIQVLGSSDWLPTRDNDTSCYLVGQHIMIDTGWSAPARLLMAGRDLLQYDHLLFTHMHIDHTMALPQILMSWRIIKNRDLSGLNIYGPDETLDEYFRSVQALALRDEGTLTPPALHPLKSTDSFETEEYSCRVMSSSHAVAGRCYRLTEKATNRNVGFSGDTAYREEFADFFKDVDLLVYEHSFGLTPCTPQNNSHCKHSSVHDAIRVAKEAHVKSLLLTHSRQTTENHGACVEMAKDALGIPVRRAKGGMTVEF